MTPRGNQIALRFVCYPRGVTNLFMLVSVVIPAYNEEKYLPKTLEGVRGLEKGDFMVEIIVVDGGSTDKTAEVSKNCGAKVVSGTHGTIGEARQIGVEAAKGEIVATTDADSDVPKNWLVKHIEALKREGVAGSFGPYKVYDKNKKTLFSLLINNRYAFLRFIPDKLKILYTSGQNIVFWKKKAYDAGGFDKNLKVMEDVDFMLRLAKAGKVVCLSDVIVMSSPRRANEGLGFFIRGLKTSIDYFILNKRGGLQIFPDIR